MVDAAQCMSLLPSLEPIVGLAAGVNIAFLNLPAFEYVVRIRDAVRTQFDKIQGEEKRALGDYEWYKILQGVNSTPGHDGYHGGARFQPIELDAQWVWSYNNLFGRRWARHVSIYSTTASLIILILGVMHQSGLAHWPEALPTLLNWLLLIIAAGALLWPLAMMWAGNWTLIRAGRWAKSMCTKSGEGAQSRIAQRVEENIRSVAAIATEPEPEQRPAMVTTVEPAAPAPGQTANLKSEDRKKRDLFGWFRSKKH